jgi:putative Holliday junction resolvase
MGRVLSVDYGMARIGLAISDEKKIIATSLTTLKAEKQTSLTAQKLVAEISHLDLEEIVIGLPYKMNGTLGPQGDEVRHFIQLLQKLTEVPIKEWDERLTSVQADRSMREGKMNRKKRAKNVDSVAALLILQSYLDSRGNTLLSEEI